MRFIRQPIKIGLMPPLTGIVGLYGREIVTAAQIACDQINEAGGVLGRELELVIRDDGSLPESAVLAAEELVGSHGCCALIGNLLSNSRISVAYRVAEPYKVPLLNFSFHEGAILSPYFFHFAALPNQQIDKMIPYMQEHYGPKMYFAGNNYEWPRGSIDAAKKVLRKIGGVVVDERYLPLGVSKKYLGKLLDNLEKSDVDVFVPYFAGEDQISLLNMFSDRGLKEKMAVVMGHYDELLASHLDPEVREGFYSSNTYFMSVDTKENDDFLKRLAQYPDVSGVWPDGNGFLTNFGEGAYVCTHAFAKAANQAGSIGASELIKALAVVEINAPQGKVVMDPSTQHARVNTYLTQARRDGTFRVIEEFGANDPVIPERYAHLRVGMRELEDDEIRLQSRIVSQMNDAVILADFGSGDVLYTNPGFDRIFGYEPKEMYGKHVKALLSVEEESEASNFFFEVNAALNQRGVWTGISPSKTKKGEGIWVSASLSVFTHATHGEVLMVVLKDVTVEQETKSILEKQREELAHYSKMSSLGEMAGGIAHEINNPLAIISGKATKISAMMEMGLASEDDIKNELKDITDTVMRIAKIISGLKAFARNVSEDDPMVLASVSDIVEDTLALCSERYKNHDIQLTVGEFEDEEIECHPVQISQCLMNLLSNAFDAVDGLNDRWVHVEIDTAPGKLIIAVIDSGTGIEEKVASRVIEPFFTTKAVGKGTGLGLSISAGLLEAHQGSLELDSESENTRFVMRIPRRQT